MVSPLVGVAFAALALAAMGLVLVNMGNRIMVDLATIKADLVDLKAKADLHVQKLVELKTALDAAIAANDPVALGEISSTLHAITQELTLDTAAPPADPAPDAPSA